MIAAGTELPLLLRLDASAGVPLLDTTARHVAAAMHHLPGTGMRDNGAVPHLNA